MGLNARIDSKKLQIEQIGRIVGKLNAQTDKDEVVKILVETCVDENKKNQIVQTGTSKSSCDDARRRWRIIKSILKDQQYKQIFKKEHKSMLD